MSEHLRWFLRESRTARHIGDYLLAIAVALALFAVLANSLGVLR